MKKITFVFGSIAGLVVSLTMAISAMTCYVNKQFQPSMWLGYTSMIVAFSLIFVGVKKIRDDYNGGAITFGKAFKAGCYIALIASTFYVLTWLVEFYLFIPDFMDKYAAHQIAQAQNSGASAADIASTKSQMATYSQLYKNPIMVIVLTYFEILPIGIVIALISALVLKRKAKSVN